jgi:CheY-like chemotaxis protein
MRPRQPDLPGAVFRHPGKSRHGIIPALNWNAGLSLPDIEFTGRVGPARGIRDVAMRKKILIVEDNTELLELLRLNLKHAGFSVATATNGIEALKKAHSISPDLVVLDLVLPELDGFAVCETLRRDNATARLPIVVLTGLTSQISRLAGLESGATAYVTKPVNTDTLVSRIKRLLAREPQPVPEAGRGNSGFTRLPAVAD